MPKSPIKDFGSVIRTYELLGDRWSFLIIREAFFGVKSYSKFLEHLGIATNILSGRLKFLVENGILEKEKDPADSRRFIYSLTEKGLDLFSIPLPDLIFHGQAQGVFEQFTGYEWCDDLERITQVHPVQPEGGV